MRWKEAAGEGGGRDEGWDGSWPLFPWCLVATWLGVADPRPSPFHPLLWPLPVFVDGRPTPPWPARTLYSKDAFNHKGRAEKVDPDVF